MADIIELLQQRDERALVLLRERNGGYCYCIVNNLLQNEQESEEALSDVWLQIWNSIPPAHPENLKAYLAKAARNTAINYIKRNSAASRSGSTVAIEELSACIPDPKLEVQIESETLKEVLNTFLWGLPVAERRMFIRRYWFGDTVPQIARRYQTNVSRVTGILYRTRKRLKRYLEQEGYSV